MNLYATITGDRLIDGQPKNVSKGQGGTTNLEIDINVLSKEPGYRVRVVNNETLGIVSLMFESKQFGEWRLLHTVKEYYDVPEQTKGEKETSEVCEEDGGSHFYEAHKGKVGTVCRKCLKHK